MSWKTVIVLSIVILFYCFSLSNVHARTYSLPKSQVNKVHKLNSDYSFDSSSSEAESELDSDSSRESESDLPSESELESQVSAFKSSSSSSSSLSLQDLESKLVLILDTEAREKNLLENLVSHQLPKNENGENEKRNVYSDSRSKTHTVTHSHHSQINDNEKRYADDHQQEQEEQEGEGEQVDSSRKGKLRTRRRKSAHFHSNGHGKVLESTSTTTSNFNLNEHGAEAEGGGGNYINEDENVDDKSRNPTPNPSPSVEEPGEKLGVGAGDASALVKKLEENSKRMETMVIFLGDLRNVLSEAVSSQEKQVALRGEVVELREEIDYLRKEVQKLRSEQVMQATNMRDPKIENKIHNDETTIEWLKENVKELRQGLEEVSSSVNVTGLVHLRQQWETEVNRVDGDLKSLRRDIEASKVNQAKDASVLLEMRGEVADLRTWHIKMGKKLLEETQEQVINESTKDHKWPWLGGNVSKRRKNLSYSLFVSANNELNTKGGERRRSRHQRKLISEVTSLETVIRDVVRDQALLHKRILKLEKKLSGNVSTQQQQQQQSQKEEWRFPNKSRPNRDTTTTNNNNNTEEKEGEEEKDVKLVLFSLNDIHNESENDDHDDNKEEKNNNRIMEYGASNSYRLSNLEKVMSDYGTTMENLKVKITSLHELRESSTQLFSALEALESKYDERITEIQTGLSKIEAAVSTVSVTNDELQEQQILESKIVQNLKKDFLHTKGQVQTNHLRLAAAQSEFLKWGLKSCIN